MAKEAEEAKTEVKQSNNKALNTFLNIITLGGHQAAENKDFEDTMNKNNAIYNQLASNVNAVDDALKKEAAKYKKISAGQMGTLKL